MPKEEDTVVINIEEPENPTQKENTVVIDVKETEDFVQSEEITEKSDTNRNNNKSHQEEKKHKGIEI